MGQRKTYYSAKEHGKIMASDDVFLYPYGRALLNSYQRSFFLHYKVINKDIHNWTQRAESERI